MPVAMPLVSLVVLGGLIGPASGGEPRPCVKEKVVTLTDKDNDTKPELTVGDKLVVRLEVRLGTGYSYQVAVPARAVLKSLGKPKTLRGDGKPGSKEYQEFRFQAVKAGIDKLELHYRRPFDKKTVPPAKVFRVQLTVKKK